MSSDVEQKDIPPIDIEEQEKMMFEDCIEGLTCFVKKQWEEHITLPRASIATSQQREIDVSTIYRF